MSSISSTSYILPPRRPWDPSRPSIASSQEPSKDENSYSWEEGKEVKGHPNVCPILDFFEDVNYYYLVMPSSTCESTDQDPSPPSDLFDLVERYPAGLLPSQIRTYLGQIADALCFLHSKGIGEQCNML
jgi:protein-serine/threonine kinase